MNFLEINNSFCVEGVPLSDIAKDYGTPAYVYSSSQIENNFKLLINYHSDCNSFFSLLFLGHFDSCKQFYSDFGTIFPPDQDVSPEFPDSLNDRFLEC